MSELVNQTLIIMPCSKVTHIFPCFEFVRDYLVSLNKPEGFGLVKVFFVNQVVDMEYGTGQ